MAKKNAFMDSSSNILGSLEEPWNSHFAQHHLLPMAHFLPTAGISDESLEAGGTMHATACHETTARSSVFLVLKCLGTFRFRFVCSPISRPFTCTMVGKPGSRSNSVMVICPCPSASILPWTNQAAEFLNSCPLHFPLRFAFHDFSLNFWSPTWSTWVARPFSMSPMSCQAAPNLWDQFLKTILVLDQGLVVPFLSQCSQWVYDTFVVILWRLRFRLGLLPTLTSVQNRASILFVVVVWNIAVRQCSQGVQM